MRRIAPLAAATLVLAACGESSTGGRGARTPPPRADAVVVRVVTGGGFTIESRPRVQAPQLSVFGDGRVIMVGPTTLEYPGPALPNLQEFRVNGDGLAHILDEARGAGLLAPHPPDYGRPRVTDLGTTRVTVRAGDTTHHVDVYALTFADGVSAEQRENRRRLEHFIELAGDPEALRDFIVPHSTRRYEPDALAVLVRQSGSVEGGTRDWPLGDLARAGDPYPRLTGVRCAVFRGSDLATALDATRAARDGDRWQSEGATYDLGFRPLLPDERTCDDLS
jgi:hypothetical protein